MKLTARQAQAIILAGEARAREIGVPVNLVVLDGGAHLQAFVRMDGAPLGAIDLAIRKARTAVLFDMPSEQLWESCKPGGPAPTLEISNGGLTAFGGGIPLKPGDGELLGAVGVSGGLVPQDLEIATAAVAAFTR